MRGKSGGASFHEAQSWPTKIAGTPGNWSSAAIVGWWWWPWMISGRTPRRAGSSTTGTVAARISAATSPGSGV